MSEEGRLFLEASGASGPLRFEWIDPLTGELRIHDVDRPALVVGSDPAADLLLDDPSIDPFHAFLQVVDGRLFAFDLESTLGLRWGEIPRGAGWVDRGQSLYIGRYCVRLVGGDRDVVESTAEPAPTSNRYLSKRSLPGVALDFSSIRDGKRSKSQRALINWALVLGGSSERCKLKFESETASKIVFTLIRNPNGLWMTNILPGMGATVNGAHCRFARLEDEDVVRVGPLHLRVIYDNATQGPHFRAVSGPASTSLIPTVSRTPPGANSTAEESSPELLLRPLLEQAGSELGGEASPFGQALVLMVRLLGDVHRDHLTLVRDELAQIRRLSRDMDKLRNEVGHPEQGRVALPIPRFANGTGHDVAIDSVPEEAPRPNPEAVKEIVSERLEAWERERQSRWRKLLKLLVQS